MRQTQYCVGLALAAAISTTSAFTPSNRLPVTGHKNNNHASITQLFAEEEAKPSSTPAAAKKIEEGSMDELMYALGVNLARQLGDVRPLVETSEELTQLARGLLDTVVGKFDEEDQRELLSRRGEDLNTIIVERA